MKNMKILNLMVNSQEPFNIKFIIKKIVKM